MEQAEPRRARPVVALADDGGAPVAGGGDAEQENGQRGEVQENDDHGHVREKPHGARAWRQDRCGRRCCMAAPLGARAEIATPAISMRPRPKADLRPA